MKQYGSNSAFLSCMQHNHLAGELRYTQMLVEQGELHDKLSAISLLNFKPSGLQILKNQL